MKRLLVTISVASGLLVSIALLHPAFAAVPVETQGTSIGPVLADLNGMTLYTFDKDSDGQSACVEQCTDNWPPHLATDDESPEGDYTVIKRADGSKQWAYKGKPLYLWHEDGSAGETKGDGLNGVWHAARP